MAKHVINDGYNWLFQWDYTLHFYGVSSVLITGISGHKCSYSSFSCHPSGPGEKNTAETIHIAIHVAPDLHLTFGGWIKTYLKPEQITFGGWIKVI